MQKISMIIENELDAKKTVWRAENESDAQSHPELVEGLFLR
jgi:hypothetical protein